MVAAYNGVDEAIGPGRNMQFSVKETYLCESTPGLAQT